MSDHVSADQRGLLMRLFLVLLLIATIAPLNADRQARGQAAEFTRADTLRGSDGPGRAWWDVTFYDLAVSVSPQDSSLTGTNTITYRVLAPGREMQLDLQPPMELAGVSRNGEALPVRRDGNAWFVTLPVDDQVGSSQSVTAEFRGRPRIAVRPPWDGGYQWELDSEGLPWVATSNQGLGASIWWPNKDYQGEEPDSQRIAITVPDPIRAVSNGGLRSERANADGTTTYEWFVTNPINNYSVSVNAGSYAHWGETYEGEGGTLAMDFWPLAENLAAARSQWTQARSTVACFEHWFGPYPFYEDGYKLVEVPYLGMEHQSGVTYGNRYANGYLGRDLSGTGLGLQWDFIVVHESAHEWWGNNITARDIADNWVHESFANYSESLYTECLTGSSADAERYVVGTRRGISNSRPIIAPHGVQATPPGDMYNKGGNMLHTLRRLVDDDEKWRGILRGLNQEFRHELVSSAEIEAFLEQESGLVLGPFFDQYLRDTRVPTLEWALSDGTLSYRWVDVVDSFEMPIRVTTRSGRFDWIMPSPHWQVTPVELNGESEFEVDQGFYAESRRVTGEAASSRPVVAEDAGLEFVSLFDGETLAGWRVNEGTEFVGHTERWTVEGGVIRGRFLNHFDTDATHGDRPVNTWLVSEKSFSDFVLRFKFRIDAGNSGFTYRSIIGSEALDSPEVDLDPGETTGQIYDTRTINGGYVNTDYLTTVDAELLADTYVKDAYNQMEVWLRGTNVKVYLNGVLITDYDHDPGTEAGRRAGYIAMELHGSTVANFKDIQIHEFANGDAR